MLPAVDLAAAAVAAVGPYLSIAAGEAAKKFGSAVAERLAGLHSKLKAHLPAPAGQEALANLAKTATDSDAQAALRQQLEKQLAADPDFQTELSGLLEELRLASSAGIVQTSSQSGEGNVNVQVAGSDNQVGGLGRPS